VARSSQQPADISDDALQERLDALVVYLEAALASGEHPNLRAFAGDGTRTTFGRVARMATDEDRFERGLQILLDGIAIDVERRL
jgi:hypothetical protein